MKFTKYEGRTSIYMKPEEALLYVGRVPANRRIDASDEDLYDQFDNIIYYVNGVRYELMTVKDDVCRYGAYDKYGLDIVLAVDAFNGDEYDKKKAVRKVIESYQKWIGSAQ